MRKRAASRRMNPRHDAFGLGDWIMGPMVSPRLFHVAGRTASVQDHWPHQRSAAVADGGRASNAAGDARQWLALPGDLRGGVDRGDSHFLTWQKLRGLVFFG